MSKARNYELAVILKRDHRRLRIRSVEGEKRKRMMNRSRAKSVHKKEFDNE